MCEARDSYVCYLAEEGEMEFVELEKMVKLVEQCLERVKSCIIRKQKSPPAVTFSAPLTTVPGMNVTTLPKMTGETLFSYF